MKMNAFYFLSALLIFSSCSKKDDTPATPPSADTYINTNAGSSWNYHEVNSSTGTAQPSDYTLTSSNKDTTINSRSYHIYNYSYGGNQYLNISGNDYYQYDSVPGGLGKVFERLYLKDNVAVGSSPWTQDINIILPGPIPIPLTVTISNKIAEKGISRTVNGNTYSDVIHVSSSLSSSSIPGGLTSSIDSYYAKNYGLIENSSVVDLDYLGVTEHINIVTQLTSANLK